MGFINNTDLNPIIYHGSPNSSGGTLNEAVFFEILGIKLDMKKSWKSYMYGWESNVPRRNQLSASGKLTSWKKLNNRSN